MRAAGCGDGDIPPGLFDVVSGMRDLLGQVHHAVRLMTGGHRVSQPWNPSAGKPGAPRGGFWGGMGAAAGKGWSGGPKDWAGRFGGPWGWWPGPHGPQDAPPWARGPKAGRGDVRAAILALLREEPRTGYQIMSEIEERSGGAWRPSPGAVYPALQQLADEGLIAGEQSGGRRIYSLTDAGRAYVEDNPDMARDAWESMAQHKPTELPRLFAQAARLGAGILQVVQAGTAEQVYAAEKLLEQTRRSLYQILAEDDPADSDK